jgi:hypothetical protein
VIDDVWGLKINPGVTTGWLIFDVGRNAEVLEKMQVQLFQDPTVTILSAIGRRKK